jgi:ribosome maturation factor RimP
MVDLSLKQVKGSLHVILTVYRPEGVNADNCAEIAKNVIKKIEQFNPDIDISLQVSSPGIDRKIKNTKEYSIFIGKGIKLLLSENNIWIGGIIDTTDDSSVTIKRGEKMKKIHFEEIKKARLDYSQEVI